MLSRIKNFLLTNQSIRQTVAKNAFWNTVGQFGGRLLRAGIIIYAARELGAESWGAFSYALSLAALLTIFSDLGITGLLTREGSKHPELRAKYLATAFFTKLMLMVTGAAVFLIITRSFIDNIEVLALLPVVVILTAIDGLHDLSNGMARAVQRMELEAWANIMTNLGILIFGFTALFLYGNSFALAIGYTVGSSIGLAAIIITLRKYFVGLLKNFSFSFIKPMIAKAWPFGLAGLMGAIMINTDIVMLSSFRSIEEVGFYSAAQRIILLLYILPGLLVVPLFPVLSKLLSEPERFRAIVSKGLRVLLIMALPLTAGGIILGGGIIELIYGKEYLQATLSFQIMAITALTTFPAILIGNAIYATDRMRVLITYAIIGIFGNVFLNLLLIPPLGMVGVAIATVLVQFIGNTYAFIKMREFIDVSKIIKFIQPIFAVAAMIGVILILKFLPVIMLVAIGGITYFAVLWLAKEPSLLEIKSIFR